MIKNMIRWCIVLTLCIASQAFADSTTKKNALFDRPFFIHNSFASTLGLTEDPTRSIVQAGAVPFWQGGAQWAPYFAGNTGTSACFPNADVFLATTACYQMPTWPFATNCDVRTSIQSCGNGFYKFIFHKPSGANYGWKVYETGTTFPQYGEVGGCYVP